MESDFGSWQSPDISRSHLYRGTFPWTHQQRYIGLTLYQKITTLSLDLFFKTLLIQVAFLMFFSIATFSLYFLLIGLLLQYVTILVKGTS